MGDSTTNRDAAPRSAQARVNRIGRRSWNRPQCETLLDEIAFVAVVSNDELLREHLGRMQRLVSACVGVSQRELFIEGP
jgi:hypothetical protein